MTNCIHYIKGGKCNHSDAPNPGHSQCVESVCGVQEYIPVTRRIAEIIFTEWQKAVEGDVNIGAEIFNAEIKYKLKTFDQLDDKMQAFYISIAEKITANEFNAGIKKVTDFIEQWALRATYLADPSKECWGISDHELAQLKEMGEG